VSILLLRDSQAAKAFVGMEVEWAGRPKYLPLSLSARLRGLLLSVHLSHYHCKRLQTGDAFDRLVMAALSTWPLDLVIVGAIAWLSIVDAPVTLSLETTADMRRVQMVWIDSLYDGGGGVGGVVGLALDDISRLSSLRSTVNEDDADAELVMPFSSRHVGVHACDAALW
jgi:hypothetical protein